MNVRILRLYGIVVVLGVDSIVDIGGSVIGTGGQVWQLQGGQAVCVCVCVWGYVFMLLCMQSQAYTEVKSLL